MVEINEEARATMRQLALDSGSIRGRGARTYAAVQSQQPPSSGFMSRVRRTLDVWMGPGQPMQVATPGATPPRSWDYPSYFNYSYQPDAAKAQESGVSLYQLKYLGRQTHVALARERCKNKQKKKRWSFGVEKQPGETAHQAMVRAQSDARVKIVSDFFRMPDGENELPEWLGLNLENILTLGVTAIVPWRKVNGQPFRLEVYDSATIIPKIDAGGRRPMGIDPDTGQPATAFQQYIKGVPFQNFSDDDLLWYGPNPVPGKVYPVGPTELLLLYVNIAYRKDAQRLAHYTDGNIASGFMPMPASWTPEQIAEWYRDFNLFVVNMPENMAKMVPIPYAGAGGGPMFPQFETLKDQWEESWLRLVFGFFDVPVSTLVKEMTRANASGNRSQADEEGEQYYEDVDRRLLNRCIAKWFGWPDIVARTEAEIETDLNKQSEIDVARTSRGFDQVNDIIVRDGGEPIKELIGVNGYFNSRGDFVPFTAAISAASAAAAGGESSGDGGESANVEGDEPAATKRLGKKKLNSGSASRTSSNVTYRY